MKKVIDFFTAHPARFFLLAALLWGGFMCYLNSKDVGTNGFRWHDLLVEANGMVFDLLVFGVLLSVYEALREKREKIQRLHEEIDDYRGWDEKEAMYRIVGAVRRLNKLGVTKISLSHCFLSGANLTETHLAEATLTRATLAGASLITADLVGAKFWGANLMDANLLEAALEEATLSNTNLSGANLAKANLTGSNLFTANLSEAHLYQANLLGTNFLGANLSKANLEWAIVGENWFEKLEEWKVKGREEIIAKYRIDENGVLREKQ